MYSQKFVLTKEYEDWSGTLGAKFEGIESSFLNFVRACFKKGKKQVEHGTAGHANPLVYPRSNEHGNINDIGSRAVDCVVRLECYARKLE